MQLRPVRDAQPLTSTDDYLPQFTAVAPYYDRLMSSVPYRMWVDYLELLFSLLGVKPQRMLDLACGTGNVSFELARRGYSVLGVDASPAMIEVAMKKSEGSFGQTMRGGVTQFMVADLRSLKLDERFTMAVCLYDSINYITDPADLRRAFARIAAHVVPGGHFIFDTNSVHALESELFTQNNLPWAHAFKYHWQSRFDRANRIAEVRMQFSIREADGALTEFNELHRERAYTIAEIETLLRATGWDALHVYDAYTTNRVRDDSERWFFVARGHG